MPGVNKGILFIYFFWPMSERKDHIMHFANKTYILDIYRDGGFFH